MTTFNESDFAQATFETSHANHSTDGANGFIAAGIDELPGIARVNLFEVDTDLETSIHLADPIARKILGQPG